MNVLTEVLPLFRCYFESKLKTLHPPSYTPSAQAFVVCPTPVSKHMTGEETEMV